MAKSKSIAFLYSGKMLRLISKLHWIIQRKVLYYIYSHKNHVEEVQCGTDDRLIIPLDICQNFVGCSYGRFGWNPYKETVYELLYQPGLPLHETALFRFYYNFKPLTSKDILLNGEGVMFDKPFGIWPWTTDSPSNKEPQISSTRFVRNRAQNLKEVSNHRIKIGMLYRFLEKEGYQPNKFSPVSGYFYIKKSGERRFRVCSGNHRVALLGCIGYQTIEVVHHPFKKSVAEKDYDEWSFVRNGQCSVSDALLYFDNWFSVDGRELAQKYNIPMSNFSITQEVSN